MDRDFVRILSYGTKGHPNFGQTAHFDSSAAVTYSEEPPLPGDAAPLLVYVPEFVVANITQSNPYPSADNTISVTFVTSVPMKANSTITVAGLVDRSVTNSTILTLINAGPKFVSGNWTVDSLLRNIAARGQGGSEFTALIDTGSRADEIIFEEFKGSGNMEIQLDRELLERRVYPAINLPKSGTRKDDLLYHPDEFKRIGMLRRQLAQRPGGEAMEVLIDHIQNSSSNAELLLTGLR